MNDQQPPAPSRVRRSASQRPTPPPADAPPKVQEPPPAPASAARQSATPNTDVQNMIAQMNEAGIDVKDNEGNIVAPATPPREASPPVPIPLPPPRLPAPPQVIQTYVPPGSPKPNEVVQVMNQSGRYFGVLFIVSDVRQGKAHGYYMVAGGKKEFITVPLSDLQSNSGMAVIGESRVRARESMSAKWKQEHGL